MSWTLKPLLSFVEWVGYVSLTNLAGFYSNEQIFTVSSSGLDQPNKTDIKRVIEQIDLFTALSTQISLLSILVADQLSKKFEKTKSIKKN
jgi:hypothetical protein